MSEGHTGVRLEPREVPAQPSVPYCRQGQPDENFRVLLSFLVVFFF